jgi:hypothetical protein
LSMSQRWMGKMKKGVLSVSCLRGREGERERGREGEREREKERWGKGEGKKRFYFGDCASTCVEC